MSTLHFTASADDSADFRPDLDSAFNDGFRGPSDSVGSSLRRWAVIAWSVAAWCAGTFVMARGIIDAAPSVLDHFQHWLG